jgi:hypothetical protein
MGRGGGWGGRRRRPHLVEQRLEGGEESWLMLGAVDVCALTTRAEKRSYEYNRAVPRVLVATPGKAKHNDRSDAWRRGTWRAARRHTQ